MLKGLSWGICQGCKSSEGSTGEGSIAKFTHKDDPCEFLLTFPTLL